MNDGWTRRFATQQATLAKSARYPIPVQCYGQRYVARSGCEFYTLLRALERGDLVTAAGFIDQPRAAAPEAIR